MANARSVRTCYTEVHCLQVLGVPAQAHCCSGLIALARCREAEANKGAAVVQDDFHLLDVSAKILVCGFRGLGLSKTEPEAVDVADFVPRRSAAKPFVVGI
ncbi:MAG TPA: hypothetical protein VN456_08680 [Desulfosporosinus sp.]|nr:hypothetical protein [Desulfosporosinus sp.]